MLNVQAERGRKQHDPNNVNQYAIDFASRAVSRRWHWEFRSSTYLWRLERFRTRYLTFKSVMEHTEITWGQSSNSIDRPAEVLEAIRQQNSFVDAYVEKGEPEWDKLKMIFEPNEEPVVQEVYDISGSEKEHVPPEE
ncbi:hypothetical protein Salat_1864600 [Sesamum alatum]|uniref:Uncharacterized protein n=1 Tax=Sesamum alatum TaxID=300844 RepID=A0AAE1Y413_9LAMI|nr:hypothetical protein Salat_1864600 [Sesamum alatum]